MRSLLTPFLLLALASPALAVDGVLEINQACAVQTGCFPADAAGLPVTIGGGGGHSYRLTSDLTVPDENTSGIEISTSDVGIDLNNFAILGPVICSGSPATCTPLGTGSGVEVVSVLNRGISVKNGSITGMGRGVSLGQQAEVTNLRVRWNRLGGIFVSQGSTVSGSTVFQNGGTGIFASAGSTVSGNTVYLNANSGIQCGSGCTIKDNTAGSNTGDGINAGEVSVINGNSVFGNDGDGIECEGGCTIKDNAVGSNTGDGILIGGGSFISGNAVTSNGGDGIDVRQRSAVQSNTIRSNTGFGLNAGVRVGYRANVIGQNTAGPVTGSGVDAGANLINGVVTPTP